MHLDGTITGSENMWVTVGYGLGGGDDGAGGGGLNLLPEARREAVLDRWEGHTSVRPLCWSTTPSFLMYAV